MIAIIAGCSKIFTIVNQRVIKAHAKGLSLNTIESLFNLAKYRFWSGEAIPGVRRPVFIRVLAQPTALQPRDPSFVSKKEDRRC